MIGVSSIYVIYSYMMRHRILSDCSFETAAQKPILFGNFTKHTQKKLLITFRTSSCVWVPTSCSKMFVFFWSFSLFIWKSFMDGLFGRKRLIWTRRNWLYSIHIIGGACHCISTVSKRIRKYINDRIGTLKITKLIPTGRLSTGSLVELEL